MCRSKFKGKILFCVIFVLGVIAVSRGFHIYYLNKQFIQTMKYDKDLGKAKYYANERGYIFKYRKAEFFSDQSFASVSTEDDAKEYMDDQGNIYTRGMHIVLFYWPSNDQYGICFIQKDPDISVNEQIYMDKEMNYQPLGNREYDLYATELIKTNKTKIENLYREAQRKWNLQ